jgi:hypothetical protein
VKRYGSFIFLLLILSVISGYLLSKASWIGRVGISLLYQQYGFLKVWWQGGGVIFIALMVLLIIHIVLKKKLSQGAGILAHVISFTIAIAGLYATYHDFRHDFSHRMLGERFHLGVYLFWIDWMLICLFSLFQKKETQPIIIADNTQPVKP